jgi:Flp pilus assembly protein TadD
MSDFAFEIAFCRSILRQSPKDLAAMEMLAGFLTRDGHIDEGLQWDRRIVGLEPSNPVHHYNLACSLSLKENHEEALAVLRSALELGYTDFKWMSEDTDLDNLRQLPEFNALVDEFKSQPPS